MQLAMENKGLNKNSYRSEDNESERPPFSRGASALLTILLLAVSGFLLREGIRNKRDFVGYSVLVVFCAWPLCVAAVWVFLTWILGWHLMPLTSFDGRSENLGVFSC